MISRRVAHASHEVLTHRECRGWRLLAAYRDHEFVAGLRILTS